MAGATITRAFEMELQGVNMSATRPGNGIKVVKWLHGGGVPAGRGNDKPRPQFPGSYPSPRYMPKRLLTWSVACVGATGAEVLGYLKQLGQAFAPIPDNSASLVVPLVFTLHNSTTQYLINGIPEQLDTLYDQLLLTYLLQPPTGQQGPYTDELPVRFTGTDPYFYENVLNSQTANLGTSSGGLNVGGFGMPFGFGSSTPGQALCTNAGNAPSYPILTFTAGGSGLSGITVTKLATLEQWSITLSMAAGDVLVVDMGAQTVLLNGTASRANLVNIPPSVFFALDADPVVASGINTIQWTASGAGSTMQVQWRSAYLL